MGNKFAHRERVTLILSKLIFSLCLYNGVPAIPIKQAVKIGRSEFEIYDQRASCTWSRRRERAEGAICPVFGRRRRRRCLT